MSLWFPQRAEWRVDDHTTSWLEAVHGRTDSRLRVKTWVHPQPASRAVCLVEASRTAPDLVPPVEGDGVLASAVLDSFESEELFAPGFASRVVVWVVAKDAEAGQYDGYVLGVGVEGRQCIVINFTTHIHTSDGKGLGRRLALGTRMVEAAEFVSGRPRSGPLEPMTSPVREL